MKESDMKKTFWQFIKYGMVGISNVVINNAVYFVIVYFRGNYLFAGFLGFMISVLNAYYWSNKYVFKEREDAPGRVWWKVLLKTYVAYAAGFFINMVLLILWIDIVKISRFMGPLVKVTEKLGWDNMTAEVLGEMAAPLINLVITIPINFVANKYWAYRQKGCSDHEKDL